MDFVGNRKRLTSSGSADIGKTVGRKVEGGQGRRQWLVAMAVASGALMAACGGGGESAATAPQGSAAPTAEAWADGPISGLGSIIVTGIRYDDSSARIENDDDGSLHDSRSLKVGMMVELRSSSVDDNSQRASASHIRFGSEIVGPIASADAATSSIVVLDQPIDITSTTVFDDSLGGGFSALTVGTVVEVHALHDAATGRYTATRIEDKPAATAYRLRGRVSGLDASAKTFNLGAARISYVNATDVTSGLADGQRVRVTLQPTTVAGVWSAVTVRTGVKRVDDSSDGRIHGTVTAFTSSSDFEVNGLRVDASGASFDSNRGSVVLGAYVRVRGAVVNGVLVATRVKVDGRSSRDSLGDVEVHGNVAVLNTATKTFTVRDIKVDYSGPIDWHDGGEANLANGRQVEVKGRWSADHSTLIATKIEFE